MATIPSFEKILLEIHQSLGLKPYKHKERFTGLELTQENQMKITQKLIEDIFIALGMEPLTKFIATEHIFSFGQFNSAIEQNGCTYDACSRHIIWYMAGYSYAPWLGRTLGFERLNQPFDAGMPSGKFWYLPETRELENSKKLVMPVSQVMEWLLDLLDQPINEIAKNLGGGVDTYDNFSKVTGIDADSMKRTFNNWRNGVTPQIKLIERYFPDDSTFNFKGSLDLDKEDMLDSKYKTVCSFIKRKNLDAIKLNEQISMTQTLIESVLMGKAEKVDVERFVELITDRYKAPTLQTIRRRLLLATAVQDGYERIGKLLDGDKFDKFSTDLALNKTLQLFQIFKLSYNLTVEASNQCESEDEENHYFERRIPYWDKDGIFLSVLPSKGEEAPIEQALKLSLIFKSLRPNDILEDHIGFDETSSITIEQRNLQRTNLQYKEDADLRKVIQILRTHSAWRTLQTLTNFELLNRIALDLTLNFKSRQMVTVRMQELAKDSQEILTVTTLELSQLLDGNDRKHRPKEAKQSVAKLLEKAKVYSQSEFQKTVVLYYEAKHALASNDFETSFQLFNKVLGLCQEYGLGKLYGEIARDTFALAVERHPSGFSIGNYEKYYRIMLAYGGLPKFEGNTPPLLEDVACFVSEFFWKELYYPYHGEKLEKPVVLLVRDKLIAETTPLISNADWTNLKSWFKKNSKLKNSRLKEVRGNTVLMHWLKLLYKFEELPSSFNTRLSGDLSSKFDTLNNYFEKLPTAISLLLEEWPIQTTITDFKLQTPLMLAANQGDLTFVKALLASQTHATQQDFKGRTALHAAVFGRCHDCVQEVLIHSPNLTQILSNDGQSVLHLAVYLGSPEIVKELISQKPELKDLLNEKSLNAFEFTKELINEFTQSNGFQEFKNYMKSENRQIGTLSDYHEVVAILSE